MTLLDNIVHLCISRHRSDYQFDIILFIWSFRNMELGSLSSKLGLDISSELV